MGSTNAPEIVLGLLVGAALAFGRWRAYHYARSPIGQAQLALERARSRRVGVGQRAALARWHALQLGVLLLALSLVVWAGWGAAH